MGPTQGGVDLTLDDVVTHHERLRAKCAYIRDTLATDPTPDDLQHARQHALACHACAEALIGFYGA